MATVHRDLKIAYYRIYKCGCSSVKRYLGAGCGFISDSHEWLSVPFDYERFTVIRDPVSRWRSGVYQMWKSHAEPGPFADYMAAALESSRSGELWTLDGNGHFQRQVEFLVDDERYEHPITLFPMPHITDVTGWLIERGARPNMDFPHERPTPAADRQMAEAMMTEDDIAQIRQHYAEDDELYRKILNDYEHVGTQ